jgi:large subunit ribosomal protein L13
MEKVIVDGNGAVLGRMGSFVAKELLKGKSVDVINSEKVIISGSKNFITEKIKQKRAMGTGASLKGPKYVRQTDRLLKRMIRGMLPWDRTKGREAFKRLKCYNANGDLSEEQVAKAISFDNKKPLKYTTMKDVVEALK